LHTLSSTFVLGYHGCDQAVADALLKGAEFKLSKNDYDWLGNGIYFWEANPKRGLDFAQEVKNRTNKINTPAVVGAVVELGFCLDLTTQAGIEQVKQSFDSLSGALNLSGSPLPQNKPGLLRRNLDCAVINYLHHIRETQGEPAIDSVKGIFVEGTPVYKDSGFFQKTHIQICVRNAECIKGVFRVPDRYLA